MEPEFSQDNKIALHQSSCMKNMAPNDVGKIKMSDVFQACLQDPLTDL